ncbi:MAG: response regulator [Spirochaetales bacterium]|nr:response regulator [Spirochaetales bacterium]
MYSVFLVDDEIVTREGIRNCIPWDNTPYTLAGEAPDGELALHSLKDIKPDILITDIKMPFMNGLELARIIKKEQPWIKIIILSGHDEFDYAKEAISINVEEYLLKPVTSSEMLEALNKVSIRIEKEKKQLTSMEVLKKQIQSTEDVMKEKWLGKLITGQIDTVSAIEAAGGMGIDLLPGGYAVMVIDLSICEGNYSQPGISRQIIASIVSNREDVISFALGMEKHILLIKNIHQDSENDMLYSIAQAIKFELQRNTNYSTAIGIGSTVNYVREIVNSYSEADKAIKYTRLTGKKIIIGATDLKWNQEVVQKLENEAPLTTKLRYIEENNIDNLIKENFGSSYSLDRSSNYDKVMLKEFSKSVSDLITELNEEPIKLIPELESLKKGIVNEKTNAMEQTKLLLKEWILFRDANIGSKHNSQIIKAKKYIKENFMSQDISLNSVASFVNTSPNHFSTVFSQEVGITFIEYLTSVRIKHAKQLLTNSKMKCSDITFETGYSDPHYFSFIFKKTTGCSPSEYRQNNSTKKETVTSLGQ